jgi:hypothetical protein
VKELSWMGSAGSTVTEPSTIEQVIGLLGGERKMADCMSIAVVPTAFAVNVMVTSVPEPL